MLPISDTFYGIKSAKWFLKLFLHLFQKYKQKLTACSIFEPNYLYCFDYCFCCPYKIYPKKDQIRLRLRIYQFVHLGFLPPTPYKRTLWTLTVRFIQYLKAVQSSVHLKLIWNTWQKTEQRKSQHGHWTQWRNSADHAIALFSTPHSPTGFTCPAFWWWLSPASPGSAAAERRRHRGLPSPEHEPGRYLFPEAARPAGTAERKQRQSFFNMTKKKQKKLWPPAPTHNQKIYRYVIREQCDACSFYLKSAVHNLCWILCVKSGIQFESCWQNAGRS